MTRDELETIVYQHMPRAGGPQIVDYNVASIMAAVDQYTITVAHPSVRREMLAEAADKIWGTTGGQTWRQRGKPKRDA